MNRSPLRGLVFPLPPGPIVAPGADSVSAAVNATLPIIESPVIEGLSAVKAALTKTGSSIAAAAGMYADTDQRLGDHLTQVRFLAAATEPAPGASAERPEGAPVDQPTDGKKPSPAKPTPQPATPMPQLDQMTGAAGTLGSAMQSMQGAMGSMQGMPGAGATPAQLADSSKPADPARPVDKTDEEEKPGMAAEGAAPGSETSQGAPVAAPAPAGPEAAPSGITL